jgi:MFS family permease
MEQKQYKVGGKSAVGVLIVVALLYFINFADRSLMSVALEPIKKAFDLTDTQAGLLPALLTAGIAILTIPASIFGDRWARRKIITVMGLIWSIFTFVTAIGSQLWQLLLARFMVGSGEAGYAPTGMAWLSVSFRKEIRSMIIGIFFACGMLGTLVGMIFGGMLITSSHDWRTPFYVFAIPGIILSIIAFFLPDYKTVKKEGESMLSKAYFKDLANVFKIKSYWLSMARSVTFDFCIIPISAWIPALLIRNYNMTPASAGLTFGLVMLPILFSPLGGFLADKWQKRSKNGRIFFVFITSLITLVCIVIAMLSLDKPVMLFSLVLGIGIFFYGMYQACSLTITNDVVPAGLRASAIGIGTLMTMGLGASLGTFFVGAVSDNLGGGAHGIQWAIMSTVGIGVLTLIADLIMLKYYHQDSAKVNDEVLAEH